MQSNSLSIIRSHLFNYYEQIKNNKLELDIEDLDKDIAIKELLLKSLEEQEDKVKVELETETELNNSYAETVKEEIQSVKQKSEVLRTYLVFMKSNEFELNKLTSINEDYIKEFWSKLKIFADKSKRFPDEMEKLKRMKDTCCEAKKKADIMMAPSH